MKWFHLSNHLFWCPQVAIFVPLLLNYNFHLRIALFGALLFCSALRFQPILPFKQTLLQAILKTLPSFSKFFPSKVKQTSITLVLLLPQDLHQNLQDSHRILKYAQDSLFSKCPHFSQDMPQKLQEAFASNKKQLSHQKELKQ